jgi:hypothetical protein
MAKKFGIEDNGPYLYAVGHTIQELARDQNTSLARACNVWSLQCVYVQTQLNVLAEESESDSDWERGYQGATWFVLVYVYLPQCRRPVRYFRPVFVSDMIHVQSFKDHIRKELGLCAGVECTAWQIRGDSGLEFRLSELLDRDCMVGDHGDSIILQFDDTLPDGHELCASHGPASDTFSYVAMVDPPMKCPEYFELLGPEVTVRVTWADDVHFVTFPEVLQVSEVINFLCKYVFRVRQSQGSIYCLYAKGSLLVLERGFTDVKSLQLHRFDHISTELLRASIKVICRISSDGIGCDKDRDVMFGLGAIVRDLIEYCQKSGCFPRDQVLRALRMDGSAITRLLAASDSLAASGNPIRVEAIPDEQIGIPARDLIPVTYKGPKPFGPRKVRRVNVSFMLAMFGDEEFQETRSRIAQKLAPVARHEKFDECNYSLKKPRSMVAFELHDNDVLRRMADPGSRIDVSSAVKAVRLTAPIFVHKQSSNSSIKLFN